MVRLTLWRGRHHGEAVTVMRLPPCEAVSVAAEHSMKVLATTDLQRNQDCQACRIAFPIGKMKNLFFHLES